MKNIKQILVNLVQDESGQDLIEYALVAALIALGSVAAMNALSTSISTAMSSVGSKLTTSV
jgi:pilus assembly protein Flp/PilA